MLRLLALHNEMIKKVADIIRHCQVIQERKKPEELEKIVSNERTAEWLDDSIAASASSNLEEWSNEDTEVIEKRFGQVQKCPLRDCGKALVALCLGAGVPNPWGLPHEVFRCPCYLRIIPFVARHRTLLTGFREAFITNADLTQSDGKIILHQKRHYGTRFRETVITNTSF